MKLLFPDDARSWLRQRYERQRHEWLSSAGSWPLSLTLGDPTEKQVAQDTALIRAWSEAWGAWTPDTEVQWEARRWPRMGEQRIPARLHLADAERVAELAADLPRHQRRQQRYERAAQTWSALQPAASWKRHLETITDYTEDDCDRLFELILWLEQHPRSDYFIRQLPIAGIDTKWIDSKRRALVSDLLQLIRGTPAAEDFHATCGLRRPPHRLRMRILCPELRRKLGGLGDIEAPLDELANLDLRPARILIVENLETGLALPDMPGCVSFMKLGLGVGVLAQLRWLQDSQADYWGDMDTHGFACLDRARAVLPGLRSILMDEATLLAHRAFWVREAEPYRGPELQLLTAAERQVFEGLRDDVWGPRVRLEQERIPWLYALRELQLSVSEEDPPVL